MQERDKRTGSCSSRRRSQYVRALLTTDSLTRDSEKPSRIRQLMKEERTSKLSRVKLATTWGEANGCTFRSSNLSSTIFQNGP